MTTIAALHIPGRGTVIGADTQYTMGNRAAFLSPKAGKIITYGNWAIASSGYIRSTNLLRLHAKALFDDLGDLNELPDKITGLLEAHRYASDCEECSLPNYDISFVVANETGAWFIDPTMGLIDIEDNTLCSSGSGSDYALAADYLLRGKSSPIERVLKSLETSCALDSGSGGRIDLFEIKASGKHSQEFRRVS